MKQVASLLMLKIIHQCTIVDHVLDTLQEQQYSGVLIPSLTQLRQICDNPLQYEQVLAVGEFNCPNIDKVQKK